LTDQKQILNNITGLIRDHNNDDHSKFRFIAAENGGGKSQLKKLIPKRVRYMDCLVVQHDLGAYEESRIDETFYTLLKEVWEGSESKFAGGSTRRAIKSKFNNQFAANVRSGKFIDRIHTITPKYSCGLVFLMDEFDELNKDQIAEWARSLRNISDNLKGTIWVFLGREEKFEILSSHKTSARYIDTYSGKNIEEMNGHYQEKLMEAAAKITAFYTSAEGYEFSNQSLKFIGKYIAFLERKLSIYKTIRETNEFLIELFKDVRKLQEARIIKLVYKGVKDFKKQRTSTDIGDEIEEGLRYFLERNLNRDFTLKNDQYKIRFDKDTDMDLFAKGRKFVSDGSIVIDKKRKGGWTQDNEIAAEVKSTSKSAIPKGKINAFAEYGGGIVPVVAGWIDKPNKLIKSFKEPSFTLYIPEEFSILMKYYIPEKKEVWGEIERIVLHLLDLPGLENFIETQHQKKLQEDLYPTPQEILANLQMEIGPKELIQLLGGNIDLSSLGQGTQSSQGAQTRGRGPSPTPEPTQEPSGKGDKERKEDLTKVKSIGPASEEDLYEAGFYTIQGIAEASIEALKKTDGVRDATAKKFKRNATKYLKENPDFKHF
jgi:hypothetical protein